MYNILGSVAKYRIYVHDIIKFVFAKMNLDFVHVGYNDQPS